MFMCNMRHCCWHTSVLPLSTGCVPRYGRWEGDGKAARSLAFPQLTNHCSTNYKVRFSGGDPMSRRQVFTGVAAIAFGACVATGAFAQETVKIGFILPMTGPQQSTGKQISAAAKLFMQQNGDTVAGKKVELIIKDDGAVPDNSKRLAQEMIVNDKVAVLAGFGVTPAALAVAPLATEGKVPEVVTAAGTSIITERSPYVVRTSFTLAQSTVPMADWASKNEIKKVVSLVSDYAPGIDAEKSFSEAFTKAGGQVVESI